MTNFKHEYLNLGKWNTLYVLWLDVELKCLLIKKINNNFKVILDGFGKTSEVKSYAHLFFLRITL